jgi:outer membrane protein OmpA-like peptidoglycan-associated protein/tetratricopeptide (TPR) repeat protein
MKKLYILIITLTLGMSTTFAQSALEKKADKYYNRLEYVKAAKTYEKIVANGDANQHVYENLANAYYNMFNAKEAVKYYEKAVDKTDNSEIYYRYAQMLKAVGKYDESIPWMEKFTKMNPADHRAIKFRENPNYLPKILDRGKDKFVVNEMQNVNTEYIDYGARVINDKLYFVSARNTSSKDYGWDDQPFLDIYQADYIDGIVSNIEKLPGKVNTKYHDGSFAFTPDGKTMYFTRDNYYDKNYKTDTTGISRLKLFSAQLKNNKWVNIKELPFNNNNYSVGHPAVSPDGKKLYFASDMPGTLGQSDIWVVDIKKNNKFGKPTNLGPNINTEGRENFPYISSKGDLYFSSDGHLGLGGLDVFACKNVDGKFSRPRNLGVPLNSGKDDFGFSIDDDTKNGFTSSNRNSTRIGDDNIFTVQNIKPICDVLISTQVIDAKTNKPIEGASVTLTDKEGNPIKTKLTDNEGNADFLIECGKDVIAEGRMDEYENNKVNVAGTTDEEVKVAIKLNPIEKIITPRELVLNPIYFDFDKWNIRSDAAFELDKVVEAMKKYEDLKINIVSHTDRRGSDKYNMSLSEKRAKSTLEYIVSKGIDASRLSSEGKGETEPAVKCTRCSKEQHQLNRRSEFLIIQEEKAVESAE